MPHKQRRLKPLKISTTATASKEFHKKQWSDESMVSAVNTVKGGMSVNQAATLYDVPRTTLQDCVKGWVKHGEKTGPNTYSTSAAEEELASFLTEVSKVGYGKTRREVALLVEAVAQEKRGEKISDGWFHQFWRENPITPAVWSSPQWHPHRLAAVSSPIQWCLPMVAVSPPP